MFGLALGRLGTTGSRPWSERALWPLGASSPGLWIDPSYSASQWQDSAGTTALSTVGTVLDSSNPIGLMLDRKGGIAASGAVLWSDSSFASGWTLHATVSAAGGVLTLTSSPNQAGAFYLNPPGLSAGKYYEITFEVVSISAGSVSVSYGLSAGNSFAKNAPGVYTVRGYALDTYIRVYGVGASTTAVIDNISVREIPGLHLSQSTSAARPVASARVNLLTKTDDLSDPSGWVYGGAAVTTQAGVAPDGGSASKIVFGTGTANRVIVFPSQSVGQCVFGFFAKTVLGGTTTIRVQVGGTINVFAITGAWEFFPTSGVSSGGEIYIRNNAAANSADIYVWHPQLELGTTATTYQRVNTAADYTATGFPQYLKFDGVDDALSSATFAAGTLTSSMDCLIAVRKDSAENLMLLYQASQSRFIGAIQNLAGVDCFTGAGSPTVIVDGTQLAGGTAVSRQTLYNAVTLGVWHIVEFRGLDLSSWVDVAVGGFTGGWQLNGAIGKILLFASGQDAARDKARARMAAYFGVTLP